MDWRHVWQNDDADPTECSSWAHSNVVGGCVACVDGAGVEFDGHRLWDVWHQDDIHRRVRGGGGARIDDETLQRMSILEINFSNSAQLKKEPALKTVGKQCL